MDELEQRLKSDAAGIEAYVSPELARRIDAGLNAAERDETPWRGGESPFRLWWLSSLTGAAAALLVIAVLWRLGGEAEAPVEAPPVVNVVPDALPDPDAPAEMFPLRAETAEFTEPLEEELEKLRSDLEKARRNVEDDLRRSF